MNYCSPGCLEAFLHRQKDGGLPLHPALRYAHLETMADALAIA